MRCAPNGGCSRLAAHAGLVWGLLPLLACSLSSEALEVPAPFGDGSVSDDGRDLGAADLPGEGASEGGGGLRLPADYAGCADGTREGFADTTRWPALAACAGAWDVPGLAGDAGSVPRCGRRAGNEGDNPTGDGCAAADSCAEGWHVCRGAAEVLRRTTVNGCEGVTVLTEPVFYAVAGGTDPSGVCAPGPAAANNLIGCGNIGQTADATCAPLAKTMGFADCLEQTPWSCGGPTDFLAEALVVTKKNSARGGVLCCRDR